MTAAAPQGILFDLGGVLVRVEFQQAIDEFVRDSGASREAVLSFFSGPAMLAFEENQLSPRGFYDMVCRELGFRGSYETFVERWNAWVSEAPTTVPLLSALHERYPIGLISNTNSLHLQHLMAMCACMRHVDVCVASCLVGASKPAPRIYEVAIARMGLPADRLVYVDDRPECVEGALRAGLRAFQFTGHDAMIEALQRAGVTWNQPALAQ